MNRTGVSSACYYPLITEESFRKACDAGFQTIELFFNSPSELSDSFINDIIRMKDYYGVDIPSVHPFMSFAESFFLFSSYERRFFDILDLYKRFFEVMQKTESGIFILHGAKIPGSIEDDLYFDRFYKLMEIGKEYNVSVCQENVVLHRAESVEYMRKMQRAIGEEFRMVLDIKQAKRASQSPYEFIEHLGKSIIHVHISDYNDTSTCIPPLEGQFDFRSFFAALKSIDYRGKYIIELYNHSYENEEQIAESYKKISKLLIDY